MKIITCLLPLLLALPVNAANHILTWTLNPSTEAVSNYCLYRQTGTPPAWVKIGEVGATNFMTISNVPPGWSVYSLTAKNVIGESAMSSPVSAFVPMLPSPPSPPIVNLQASIQSRESTSTLWAQAAYFNVPVLATDKTRFFQGVLMDDLLKVRSSGVVVGSWSNIVSIPFLKQTNATYRSQLFANR